MLVLRSLACMPFLDGFELASLSGWSRASVYGSLSELRSDGLVESVGHGSVLLPHTRRFCVTAAGLGRLAEGSGGAVDGMLETRPVSSQWRQVLLGRLDAVGSIYRLACALGQAERVHRFRWYRGSPLDAGIELAGGLTVGVVRQGLTSARTAFAKRIWRLLDEETPGLLLVLARDEVRLRHAGRLLAAGPVPALIALERDATTRGAAGRVWRLPSFGGGYSLRSAVRSAKASGELPAEPRATRADIPQAMAPGRSGRDIPVHILSVLLTPAEKRVLDALSDWPWIAPGNLAGLLGLHPKRLSRLLAGLERRAVVSRLRIGECVRLVLADRGLALLARRDRTAVGTARRLWSAAPLDPNAPLTWRNISGSKGRQLLRNIEHTDAVHRFMGSLAAQARDRRWEIVQLDPPRRASRYFRHDGKLRSVHPDAFGILRRGGETFPFFLEWERRAVRPVTMARRLAPYLRYYASRRPIDDHGAEPAVLVVFDAELAAGHFLRVAHREMTGAGLKVPLWVSNGSALARVGPLGPAWWVDASAQPAFAFR